MGLVIIMIRVLAQQQDIDAIIRCIAKGVKDILFGWKYRVMLTLFIDKMCQFLEVGLREFFVNVLVPAFRNVYLHIFSSKSKYFCCHNQILRLMVTRLQSPYNIFLLLCS